ncbi:MAG TPA: hypothetical protein VHR97_08620 [Candidatus Baltobacteraceae bacterium]|jgi:hypothetical protein|nr:hypothetical protein [Candidatus Baltobacteraceae bacterium]
MTAATSTLEPAITGDYVKGLVAANLRALTGAKLDFIPDTPGGAIEALIGDDIRALEELEQATNGEHGSCAEFMFVSLCGDFLVDATVVTLRELPGDALAHIRTLAEELKNELRGVLGTARDFAQPGAT